MQSTPCADQYSTPALTLCQPCRVLHVQHTYRAPSSTPPPSFPPWPPNPHPPTPCPRTPSSLGSSRRMCHVAHMAGPPHEEERVPCPSVGSHILSKPYPHSIRVQAVLVDLPVQRVALIPLLCSGNIHRIQVQHCITCHNTLRNFLQPTSEGKNSQGTCTTQKKEHTAHIRLTREKHTRHTPHCTRHHRTLGTTT
jgi:hypothetical protein